MKDPLIEPQPGRGVPEASLPVKIVISTTHRTPDFLDQTLASLFMAGSAVHKVAPVHLMVGSLEEGYLENIAHHGTVHAHLLSKAQWLSIKDCGVHRRSSHNYARCLALAPGDSRGLLVCEDDVVFQDGFCETLAAIVAEIEAARGGAPFILALYAFNDFRKQIVPAGGEFYARYDARGFFGTQCVYYSTPLLPDLADLVFREGFEKGAAPYDMLVKQYCTGKDILFASRASIVQHIGKTTTGLGAFHASSSFGRPVRETPGSDCCAEANLPR